MKLMFTFIVMLSCSGVMAVEPFGPFPHERTDTAKLKNTTTGRYIYLGEVPKFDGKELEITIAKMSLTARVTAHVTQARVDSYARDLLLRWKKANEAINDPLINFHPLVQLGTLAEGKPEQVQAWVRIASQYSQHSLASTGLDVYAQKRNMKNFESSQVKDDYKKLISEAYFRYLFKVSGPAENFINDNLRLSELTSVENSRKLFLAHLGHLFTYDSTKPGHLGYLTLVYPIAATTKGPFDQPKEMITDMKTAESIEARWWSNMWKDEFSGLPFLLIEYSGVAFHAPISNYVPLDVWFLQRGYVSHGCHRMDSSDLLELRTLMPLDLKKAANQIKVTVLNNFDVVDWDKDGSLEAVDVKYYKIPTQAEVAANLPLAKSMHFSVETQMNEFYKKHKYASKFFDAETQSLKKIPKYSIQGRTLKVEGTHENVPLARFAHRPSRIIQYVEDGVSQAGFDDSRGKYPPKYFQQH
ncbi:MAG TPA: hypothetical protein VNJ01_00630 [Bacteriovoracaceae bacterium]|nr:hypothetical protein [Bacteriovoracaceae bacterium]